VTDHPEIGGGTEHFGGLQRQTAEVGNPAAPMTGGFTRGLREGIRLGILQVLEDLDQRIAPPGASFATQLRLFQVPQVAPTPREEVPETTTVKFLPGSPEDCYLLGVAELRERLRMRTDELLTNLAHGREPWNA
jgi:hypothetical protein